MLTELVSTRGFEVGMLHHEESIEYCALIAVIRDFASFELLDAVFATAAAVASNAAGSAQERRDVLDIGHYVFPTQGMFERRWSP